MAAWTRSTTLAVLLALLVPAAALGSGSTAAPSGYGTPACLRGHWVANQAETNRVLHALVPVGGFEAKGKLYMQFRNGMFQYGSTELTIKNTIGDTQMTARARFFTLARYTARTGRFTTSRGTSTIEYGPMTATKDGKTYTVPGPAPVTRATPGGTTPFQCRGSTLRVKLPSFASLGWITLRRG